MDYGKLKTQFSNLEKIWRNNNTSWLTVELFNKSGNIFPLEI
jgi:hypothetical protein